MTLLLKKISGDSEEVTIENRALWGKTMVTLKTDRSIASVKVVTFFPPRVSMMEKKRFTVAVPPCGVTVVRIQYQM